MAGQKKRKASGAAGGGGTQANSERTKLTINSWEDVADSGDEFQISRDKILLEEEPARKRRRRIDEEYEELVPSDEEILELPSSDEEDIDDREDVSDNDEDSAGDAQRQENGEEEDERWGTSRKDYYNADKIETEVDALEEEEEALRIQQKQLLSMTDADFGFDETDWLAEGRDGDNDQADQDLAEQVLPQLEVQDDMPREERMRILTSRYPEFEALATEYVSLQGQYEELSTTNTMHTPTNGTISGPAAKMQCLSAYLGVLSMYFALLMSGPLDKHGNHTTIDPVRLRKHPIMEFLVQARTNWQKIKDVTFPEAGEAATPPTAGKMKDEVLVLLDSHKNPTEPKRPKKKQKSKAEARALKAKEAADEEKAARLQQTKDNLAQIAKASAHSKGSLAIDPTSTNGHNSDSDLGDTAIGDARQQDRRKKSLAFYTSQIASKTKKRALAGKDAGGDEDIPHKERLRDRIARLNAQAEVRGQNGRDELGNSSEEEEDARISAEVRKDADGEDYYQTISSATQRKKEEKAAHAAALKEAQANGALNRVVEEVGADGKRAITYAIQKNKGLTPRRKKEARNPRLKKRLKYQEKMKKLGSIRPVYKGGEGRGGYGGETTGIKSGIIRSRKL